MRPALLAFVCLLSAGCVRARERRAEEHLRNELNFLVPFVDLGAEEKAVRNVLGQRKLIIDEVVRGEGYVALSATSFDQRRSAVRIITARGVVAAEDGDADELFGDSKVALFALSTGGEGAQALLGIAKTERGSALGCARFYRVRPDANLAQVDVHVERFGTRACLASLSRDETGTLRAQVGWPSLSAGHPALLSVDMRIDSGRLDQADPDQISIRIASDEGPFIARELARVGRELGRAGSFAARQAGAVARAALSLCANESSEQQLAAYQSGLGHQPARGADAELVALTRAHIEHGWDDPLPEEPGDDADTVITPGAEPPNPRDNEIIEPAQKP